MSCKRGKASPDSHTKLKLFADSGGYCQNPECNVNLFQTIGNVDFHIAEMAHIISAGKCGPRTNLKLSQSEKGDFYNLILLCPTCHTKIDKAESEYSEELIKEWKNSHSKKINELFNIKLFTNRAEARSFVAPLLNENKMIFDIYGPLTDERFNPESEMPQLWLHKIQQVVLPNNRKILQILDVNYSLLSEEEVRITELFRQHVSDFEAKHINKEDIDGLQFPRQLNNIFTK